MIGQPIESSTACDVLSLPVPQPRCPITIREGRAADLPFIDRLQKMHQKMVGWMPQDQLRQKIEAAQVIIAEGSDGELMGYSIGTDRYHHWLEWVNAGEHLPTSEENKSLPDGSQRIDHRRC